MTHDEYLEAAASESLTAEQRRILREHAESCPECAAVSEPVERGRFRSHTWWLATAAILFLALWIWRELAIRVAREHIRSDRAEIIELTNARDVLQQQKEKLAQEMSVIAAADVKAMPLTGESGVSGKFFIDPASGRGVLVAAGLKANGVDHDYQVWLYGSDPAAPKSSATFDVLNGHTSVIVEHVPADLKRVAVTLEKNGGANAPGSGVVLSGGV